MNKLITAGMAALTLAGTGLAAAPASARDWNGYGYRQHGDGAGYAIAGGIVGLALGAALASHHDHYNRDHYRYGYSQPYGYGGYNGYSNYNGYNGYGYSQPYGYQSYGYSQPYGYNQSYGYDRDGDGD